MSDMKFAWILCQTSEGAFSQERNIQIELLGGQVISLFADKSLVKHLQGRDYLRVTLVGTNGTPHTSKVLLPTEPFETGTRWIDVPDEQFAPA